MKITKCFIVAIVVLGLFGMMSCTNPVDETISKANESIDQATTLLNAVTTPIQAANPQVTNLLTASDALLAPSGLDDDTNLAVGSLTGNPLASLINTDGSFNSNNTGSDVTGDVPIVVSSPVDGTTPQTPTVPVVVPDGYTAP